jgi:hypothetical protein
VEQARSHDVSEIITKMEASVDDQLPYLERLLPLIFLQHALEDDKSTLARLYKKYRDTWVEVTLWMLHKLVEHVSIDPLDESQKWCELDTDYDENWWNVRYKRTSDPDTFRIYFYNQYKKQEITTYLDMEDFGTDLVLKNED